MRRRFEAGRRGRPLQDVLANLELVSQTRLYRLQHHDTIGVVRLNQTGLKMKESKITCWGSWGDGEPERVAIKKCGEGAIRLKP